ncbi:MAG: EamA family transporter [Aeromicrobium sp.]|nr:EamA family transporter [Aeromicrobium sp.]
MPALLATVLLWASAFVGIRAVGDTFSPGSLSLGRLVVGALVLTLFARPRRDRLPSGRPLLLVLFYGAVWFGAYNIALNAAERDLDAGTTALIVNIGPIIAALVAGFLYREGFPKFLLIGMGVAFAGVVLIAVSTRQDSTAVDTASTTGVLLCVAAAVFYAFGAVAQKPALAHMEPVMSVWLGCLVGLAVCLPFAPALVDELGGASFHDIAWLVYLGVFPTAIGFSTWSYALKRISTGQAASTTYLVPAVATLISWAVLDEVPAALAFVGGAMCLVGVAITRVRSAAIRRTVKS